MKKWPAPREQLSQAVLLTYVDGFAQTHNSFISEGFLVNVSEEHRKEDDCCVIPIYSKSISRHLDLWGIPHRSRFTGGINDCGRN